jgi:hypothetical protein
MNQLRMFNVDSAPPSTSLSKFVRAVRRSPMGWLFLTEEEAAELVRVDFGGRATVEPLDAMGRFWLVWHRTAEGHGRWLRAHLRRLLESTRKVELLVALMNAKEAR